MGQPLDRLIPERFRPAHASHSRRFGESVVPNRGMGTPDELWGLRADGVEFPVEASISQVEAAGRKLFTVILRDVTDRKSVAEALRASEERLRLAVEGARLGTWHWDLETGNLEWSSGCLAMFGLPPGAAMSYAVFLAALHPEDRMAVDEAVQRSLAQRSEYDIEFRTVWRDSSEHWIAARGRGYYTPEGQAVRMEGVVMDVTERRQSQERLRDSENFLQSTLDALSSHIAILDDAGTIIAVNSAWHRFAANNGGDPNLCNVGCNYLQVCRKVAQEAAEAGAALAGIDQVACGEREEFSMEYPCHSPDEKRWFTMRVTPLANQGHGRVVLAHENITGLKLAEQQLLGQAEELSRQADELIRAREAQQDQTRMLQLVLDNMGEGLVAADLQGRFMLWNDSASKLLSRTAANLPPEQWSSHYACYLPDGITPCPTDRLPLVRALRGEPAQMELIIQHADTKARFWLEFTGRPVHDAQGNLRGGVVVFRDVSERKRAEQEIRALNQDLERRVLERTCQLQAANQELEAFTYSVSHDLRAPLRHISGFSQILAEEFGAGLPTDAQRHLERIQNGTRRMGLLVDDLLNLARLGRRGLSLRHTELNPLIEEVLAELAPEYTNRQVEFRIATLPPVECDPGLIKQVFQNLLANALKFTRLRAPAVIEVGRKDADGVPVVFLRDNGVGFNMKYIDKLFGVFQRLHRQEDFEGTGVGLATVQRIMKKHGGRIWAEAELDKGATFYFSFGVPAKDERKTKSAGAGESR